MDVNQDLPVIISDDDDDDDIVLLKEEKATDADKKEEDDVIFISHEPLLNPEVRYFQSAFSSAVTANKPPDKSYTLALTTKMFPDGNKHNSTSLKPSQSPCSIMTVSEQEMNSTDKISNHTGISSVQTLHESNRSSERKDISLASTHVKLEKFTKWKFSKVDGITSVSSQSSNTELCKNNTGEDKFLDAFSGITATLPVSDELVKISPTLLDPSSNIIDNVLPHESPDIDSKLKTFTREIPQKSGTSKQCSSFITFPVFKPAQEMPKFSDFHKMSLPYKNDDSSFDFDQFYPEDFISLLKTDTECDKSNDENRAKTNMISDKTDRNFGESKEILNLVNSIHVNQFAVSVSSLNCETHSKNHCNVTKTNYKKQKSVNSVPSDSSNVDYSGNMSSISGLFPSVRKNHLGISDQMPAVKSNYLSNGFCCIDRDKISQLHSKCSSPDDAPVTMVVEDLPSTKGMAWRKLKQAKKQKSHHYKKKYDKIMKKLSNKTGHKSVTKGIVLKVRKSDSKNWQVVSLEAERKTYKMESDSHVNPFLERKRKKLLKESDTEMPNEKIGFKLSPTKSDSSSENNNLASHHTCRKMLKKKRVENEIPKGTNKIQPKISICGSESDSILNQILSESKNTEIICVVCDEIMSRKKFSKCGKGHVTCVTCLESLVKIVLTDDIKQKKVVCPSCTCNEVISSDELKNALPSFVVEILEQKLDKEYMIYISKWMFTDEQLKSRSEFTTLDTETVPSSSLIINKYEELPTQNSNEPTENFPSYWSPMDSGAPVMAFEVVPDTEEYRALACQFHETLAFGYYDIVKIFRIQNPILWKYFSLKQSEMIQENEGNHVLEKQLYHGTYHSALEAIARKGFDWRLSGKHGTSYGCGSYFASTAQYSHSYTDQAGKGTNAKRGSIYGRLSHCMPRKRSSFFPYVVSSSLNSVTSYLPTQGQMLSQPLTYGQLPSHPLAQGQMPSTQVSSQPPAQGQMSSIQQQMSLQPPAQGQMSSTQGQVSSTQQHTSSQPPTQGQMSLTQQHTSSQPPTQGQMSLTQQQMSSQPPTWYQAPPVYLAPINKSSPWLTASTSSYASTGPKDLNDFNNLLSTNFFQSASTFFTTQSLISQNYSSEINGYSTNLNLTINNLEHSTSLNVPNIIPETNGTTSQNLHMPNTSQACEKGTMDLTSAFSRDSSSQSRFMFVARVLVGRQTLGKHSLKRPPPLDENSPYGQCFDSCVDNLSSPQVYVVFDSNQCYPEYVIEYNCQRDQHIY